MVRIGIVALSGVLLFGLSGCTDEPGGSVSFTITGAASLSADLQGEVGIVWDGENPWTRELDCELDSSLDESWWALLAVDRSVGNGLAVGLSILDYDGDATYVRDRFQPDSALSIEHEDAETEVRTLLDVAKGGQCDITVEEGSKAGTFACTGVPLQVDGVENGELVGIDGSFRCNTLGRSSSSSRGSRYGYF
jgi:hypothetical protein